MRIVAGLLSLSVVLGLATGCAKKESSSSATQTPAETSAPSASAPAVGGEHVAGQVEEISTEGSASDIMARVDQEETDLGKIISNAELEVVHKKAFAIRDLVVAAADKATVTGSDKVKLDERVSRIKSLATELDKTGDAGDLSKTKAGYTDLRVELQAIRQLLGQSK